MVQLERGMLIPLSDRVAAFHAGQTSPEQFLLELMCCRWAMPSPGSLPKVERNPSRNGFTPVLSEVDMLVPGEPRDGANTLKFSTPRPVSRPACPRSPSTAAGQSGR